MGFPKLVVGVAEVAEDGPRVDARVDAQQSQPDPVEIAVGERPEAAVGVAVLGGDAGMHHERAEWGDREDPLVQQDAASGQHQVGPCVRHETLCLRTVRAARLQPRQVRRQGREATTQLGSLALLPADVVLLESKAVVEPKRKDVQKAERAATPQLPTDALATSRRRLVNDHYASERRERG